MKKYYIIFASVGTVFLLSVITLIANPSEHALLKADPDYVPTNTAFGNWTIIALLAIAAILIAARLIYVIVKWIRKLNSKLKHKEDKQSYSSDAKELYTEAQSSENISDFLISTSAGKLGKDNKER